MAIYALIYDGVVQEVIQPAFDPEGAEYPIEVRYPADFVKRMVDISSADPMPAAGWSYLDGVFSPYHAPIPTPAEILARNVVARDYYLGVATLAIAPLQDAVDLDDATPADLALLKKWKQFRVAVNRIDLKLESPVWPDLPVYPKASRA